MLKLDSIKVDLAAEQTGQYVEIPDWERTGEDGKTKTVSLGVRSLEIPAYRLALDKLLERYKRVYKGKAAPPEVREADIGKLLATHILFDWKGITPDYTPDTAMEFLADPAGRELAKQVVWAAVQVAEVSAEFEKDSVKN